MKYVLGCAVLLFSLFCQAMGASSTMAEEQTSGKGTGHFSSSVPGLLKKYNIPGAALAVMKDGRLVLAKGYGWADKHPLRPVKPETLFRIASVSKPITSVGVLKLVQEGKLDLNQKAFDILSDLGPFQGATPDLRLGDITILDLLRHSGGWDSSVNGDPQFLFLQIAGDTGLLSPADPRTIIRYWMGTSLPNDPHTKYVYANFGYNVLARIIEKVTGQSYEDYMNASILLPLGIRRMQVGKTLREQRADGETTYYAQPGAPLLDSAFPSLGKVPAAYGAWNHPGLDGHGGWIASAIDLLRFVRGVEGSGGQTPILSTEMITRMTAYQGLPGKDQSPDHYYALGWNVDSPGTAKAQWSHSGALSGSNAAYLVRRADGVSYAITFNSLPDDMETFFTDLTTLMNVELSRIKTWPKGDLFPKFP